MRAVLLLIMVAVCGSGGDNVCGLIVMVVETVVAKVLQVVIMVVINMRVVGMVLRRIFVFIDTFNYL